MYVCRNVDREPARAIESCTQLCSVGVSGKDLAGMAATLAKGGSTPGTGKGQTRAESGGGMLAVAPGQFGIAGV